MNAQPLRIGAMARPRILDGDGEVVLFEEAEREKGARARAVPAQIGEQNVVTEAERAQRVRRPFGRVAALTVNEKDRRTRRSFSRSGEDRRELRGSALASRMPVVGDAIARVAKSPYQVFAP